MIAFEKKSPLILISATAVKVTFMKKLSNDKISQIWMIEFNSKIHIVSTFKSSNKCV